MATAHWPLAAKRAAARSDWLLVGAIVIYLCANLPYLVSWPAVNGDEGREANAFWVASGVDPSAQTLDPVFKHDPLYKGGLQQFTVGLSFRVFGLGLWQGRLVHLIWGGLLLIAVFLAGRRLYGPTAGAVAVLFLALSQPWLVSAHIIRPDIVVATLTMAAVYCALRNVQDGGRGWSLLAGLLMGLSFDVHPNSLAFMPMVGFVYLAKYGWRGVLKRDAWLYVAGIGLGAVYYIVIRIAPDPVHFLDAFQYWIGVDKRPPALATRGGSPLDAELGRWTQYLGHRWMEGALLGLGVLTAAIRMIRQKRLDPLLVGWLVSLVVFTILVSSKTEFYMILFFPMLILMVAAAIGDVFEHLGGSRVVASALVVLLAVGVMGFEDNFRDITQAASNFEERNYYSLTGEIQAVIPPGSRVIAPPLFWIGLSRPPYYLDFVDFYVWERSRREQQVNWAQFVSQINPEYVILDSKAKSDVTNNNARFMEANADLVASFRHVNYTRVEVWKMRGAAR
ncbi:MAG: glycosyltransferase family 39 protein [Chloroflexi bacterium]|nr:glycosyltransferase family 39 protein [Chloroflexota bacterium]